MARLLLEAGADCNNENFSNEDSPLHVAVRFGHTDIVELLLSTKAAGKAVIDVNARNKLLRTPLHYANMCHLEIKSEKYVHIIQMLINAGADVNSLDYQNFTPLFYAIVHKFQRGIELMSSLGAYVRVQGNLHIRFLHETAVYNDPSIMEQIIKFNAVNYVNETNIFGDSCLHIAARLGCHKSVEFALKIGVQIDLLNDKGLDALGSALNQWPHDYLINFEISDNNLNFDDDWDAIIEQMEKEKLYKNHVDCLRRLIKAGADVNRSLDIVLEWYQYTHSNFANVLLKNGAIVDFDNLLVQKFFVETEEGVEYNKKQASRVINLLLRLAALSTSTNFCENRWVNNVKNFYPEKLDDESQSEYDLCRKELESMIITKIQPDNLTTYHVFLVKPNISGLMRNTDITDTFLAELQTPDIIPRLFPIYQDLLYERFTEEFRLHKLKTIARKGFDKLIYFRGHTTIINIIMEYLDEPTLYNLARV